MIFYCYIIEVRGSHSVNSGYRCIVRCDAVSLVQEFRCCRLTSTSVIREGDSIFLSKVGTFLTDYTASHAIRQQSALPTSLTDA